MSASLSSRDQLKEKHTPMKIFRIADSRNWPLCLATAICLLGCTSAAPPSSVHVVPVLQADANATTTFAFPEVGIDGDAFTVGGEKFQILAIGYEIGIRPGMIPWDHKFRPDLLHADFKRIKEAGFNTLRTWSPMTDAELEIAAQYGFWVIQGLWYDPGSDFSEEAFQKKTFEFVEREVTRSSKHPNIFCYLLGNEPHGDAVYWTGIDKTKDFYKELVRLARKCDPKRKFSYSNCVVTDFIKPDEWDFAAVNVYPYSPVTIDKALGYRTYLELLKHNSTQGKPLVITEFGLSVSPSGDGRGYGGNTLEQQRDGVIQMYDTHHNVGVAGNVAFMWVDGWWKFKDENAHDDHAEEWYGLVEVDSHVIGNPRPVYYAIKEYNIATRTAPRDAHQYTKHLPIEVWSPSCKKVQARIGSGSWIDIEKHESAWWRTRIDVSGLAPGQVDVWTRGIDNSGHPVSVKHCIVEVGTDAEGSWRAGSIRFVDPPETALAGESLTLTVEVLDTLGSPVPSKKLRVDNFRHTGWSEEGFAVVTDENGRAEVTFPADRDGIYSYAAATVFQQGRFRRKVGDYIHITHK